MCRAAGSRRPRRRSRRPPPRQADEHDEAPAGSRDGSGSGVAEPSSATLRSGPESLQSPWHLPGVLAWRPHGNSAGSSPGTHGTASLGPCLEPHGTSPGSLPGAPQGSRPEPCSSSRGVSLPPWLLETHPLAGCPTSARPTRPLLVSWGTGVPYTGTCAPLHSLMGEPGPPQRPAVPGCSKLCSQDPNRAPQKSLGSDASVSAGPRGTTGARDTEGISACRTQGSSGPSPSQPDARP